MLHQLRRSSIFLLFLLLPTFIMSLVEDKFPLASYYSYWTAYLNISYVDSARHVWHTERTETGRFSSSVVREEGGVAVQLLAAANASAGDGEEDDSGCFPPFRYNFPLDEKWIAIVQRGKCTFNQKISNALAVNASGVLVYDSEEGGTLQSMKIEQFPVPSVFTYRWKGLEILRLMQVIDRVYLTLQEGSHCFSRQQPARSTNVSAGAVASNSNFLYCTPPQSDLQNHFSHIFKSKDDASPFWNWNLTEAPSDAFNVEKRTSVLFVSISFVVLMIISLAWLVFYYVQRFRYIHAKDQLERKLCSQAKRALAIISTSVLKKDDLEMRDFSETCAVCIETYRVADVVRILPCKHQFHKSCIDQWLLEKRTCPMCKMDILKHYGLVEDANSSDREDAVMSLA